jgi:hypothetical protein
MAATGMPVLDSQAMAGLADLDEAELRRLAGVAAASKYLGFIGGQDPEQWLRQSPSGYPG